MVLISTHIPPPRISEGVDTDQLHAGMMEWHTSLVYCDILQMLGGFSDMHTLNGLGGFSSVLKVNTKI